MRVVRVVLAVVAMLVTVPALTVGVALLAVTGRLAPDGTLGAWTVPVRSDGYAVVVPDLDRLLRADVPFARAGRTSVKVTVAARGATAVPVFIGLAPQASVAAYLDGVPHSEILAVGLARRSALPVVLSSVPGAGAPTVRPDGQGFWLASSDEGTLHWAAGEIRGQQVSLVLMATDATAGVAVAVHGAIRPAWLVPTAWAMVILGVLGMVTSVLLLLGLVRRHPPLAADGRALLSPAVPTGQHTTSPEPATATDPPEQADTEPEGVAEDGAQPDGAAGAVRSRAPLIPPPYRPASEGRVWASASVRAQTLAEVLDGSRTIAPASYASGAHAAPAVPLPEPVITPEWVAPAPWPPLAAGPGRHVAGSGESPDGPAPNSPGTVGAVGAADDPVAAGEERPSGDVEADAAGDAARITAAADGVDAVADARSTRAVDAGRDAPREVDAQDAATGGTAAEADDDEDTDYEGTDYEDTDHEDTDYESADEDAGDEDAGDEAADGEGGQEGRQPFPAAGGRGRLGRNRLPLLPNQPAAPVE